MCTGPCALIPALEERVSLPSPPTDCRHPLHPTYALRIQCRSGISSRGAESCAMRITELLSSHLLPSEQDEEGRARHPQPLRVT